MRLREIRLKKGLTQRQVSDSIGCAPSVYSRYETGDREPSIDTLIRLSRCLGVSIDCLVGNETTVDEGLNGYEAALVSAARVADERAREDAMNILLSHKAGSEKMLWRSPSGQRQPR